MKSYNVVLLEGDGIGPEIVRQAKKVLDRVSKEHGFSINYYYGDIGGCSIDKYGVPLTDEVLYKCRNSDAVLLGAVGGETWNSLLEEIRPEAGLLRLRKDLGLFANLRHIKIYDGLRSISPIRHCADDIMIVRELIGGIYFGKKYHTDTGAYDVEEYSRSEIERVARVAFETAKTRKKRLCSVDKANVLSTSRLWREVVEQVSEDYPDVEVTNMYVDNCAMQLVLCPEQFDVILTSNMFGDILSDEAAVLSGSIGMIPSASLGQNRLGLYESIHGSAPQIAGKNLANPIATILSAAMMLRHSFYQEDAAVSIESSVSRAIKRYRTVDIYSEGAQKVTCEEMGNIICEVYNSSLE